MCPACRQAGLLPDRARNASRSEAGGATWALIFFFKNSKTALIAKSKKSSDFVQNGG